jgi:hypothetical protein
MGTCSARPEQVRVRAASCEPGPVPAVAVELPTDWSGACT